MLGEETTAFSQAILQDARQEAEQLLETARREANHIVENARAEVKKVAQSAAAADELQKAKLRYNQTIATAELQAQRQLLLSQERLIAEVQDRVKARLLQMRTAARYPQVLTTLIQRGLAEMEGESFELVVAPEDRALITAPMLQGFQKETGKVVRLSTNSQPEMTGVILQRVDQPIICDYSLQALWRRQQEELRVLVAQELFTA